MQRTYETLVSSHIPPSILVYEEDAWQPVIVATKVPLSLQGVSFGTLSFPPPSNQQVANRDTTLRSMQRNYETLVSTHEESRQEHARRKVAFDQVVRLTFISKCVDPSC